MFETRKATKRRFAEHDAGGFPWRDVFKGRILDVGSGNDGLVVPGQEVRHFDLPDGGGDLLTDFFPTDPKWDVIHGSQVCEHFNNPAAALRSWLALLKPGGYIIASVPDFARYEKLCFPSKFNAGHRSTWSLDWPASPAPIHCKLPAWLEQFEGAVIVLCRLVDTNFDYTLGPEIDQTYDASKNVECFCEFVLRKL